MQSKGENQGAAVRKHEGRVYHLDLQAIPPPVLFMESVESSYGQISSLSSNLREEMEEKYKVR